MVLGCAPSGKPDPVSEDTGPTEWDSAPPDGETGDTAQDSAVPDTADSADTGELPDTGEPAPSEVVKAVWSSQVKNFSDPGAGAGCGDSGWNTDSGPLTRDALLAGGLDTYIATLGSGDPTDC